MKLCSIWWKFGRTKFKNTITNKETNKQTNREKEPKINYGVTRCDKATTTCLSTKVTWGKTRYKNTGLQIQLNIMSLMGHVMCKRAHASTQTLTKKKQKQMQDRVQEYSYS